MLDIRKLSTVFGSVLFGATLYAPQLHAQPGPQPSTASQPVVETAADGGTASPPTSSPPAPAPASTDDVDLSAYTEAAAIASQADQGPSLHFYGFADFSFSYIGGNSGIDQLLGDAPAFATGNVNLYAAASLSERWKSLVEIRFSVLPDGSLDQSTLKRIDTSAFDYTNLGAKVHWGGIILERAWLEYSLHQLLTIRGGTWLTPVGIWNVDHGTPTIIPALRPWVINNALFPLKQTGLELYGSQLIGETTLGYHFTISNGRGSLESYGDLDNNKALGGRVYVNFNVLGSLTLGASIYRGRNTTADMKVVGTSASKSITEQYDELSSGADLLWKWQGVHLQAEFMSHQVRFTSAGAIVPPSTRATTGELADYHEMGGYVLLGYRLPLSWLPLMPFIQYDALDNGGGELRLPTGPRNVSSYSVGLNYRPIPSVALKAQYYRLRLQSSSGTQHADAIRLAAAWSF